jgi:peptide/nickel transport system permease protein
MNPSPPSATHPLGTLPSQYDILYGVIWGTRNAFRIGLAVVAANLAIGLVLGAIAGYFGGLVDEIIMRVADVFYAIPLLVMAMALVIALGRGLQSIVLVLIVLNWPTYTRMIRAEILVVRNMDYIQAARASGSSHLRILFRHVLPNSIFSAIIVASMNVGMTILVAAALSFLGLGSDTGYADWGAMVSTCRNFIVGPPENRLQYWYLVFIPGFTIALFVLGWNLLGDAVRDVFDPRMRRR